MRPACSLIVASLLSFSSTASADENDDLACPAAPSATVPQRTAEEAARDVCDALRVEGARGAYEVSLEAEGPRVVLSASDPWGHPTTLTLGSLKDVPFAAQTLARRVFRREGAHPAKPCPPEDPEAAATDRMYSGAGLILFAVGYLPAVAVVGVGVGRLSTAPALCSLPGAECNVSSAGRMVALLVPVVGPLALYDIVRPGYRALIFVDSAVQLTGAVLAAIGRFREDARASNTAPASRGAHFAPWFAPNAAGAAVTVVE
jgi:hypothetical protein